jgi:hypothetical protein
VATEEERDKKAKTGLTKPKIESKKKLTKGKKNETKTVAAGPLSKVYQNSMMSQVAINLYSEEEDLQPVPNDSMLRDHETVRSKMFEDSDASTFRMISFGGGMGSR